MRKSNLKRCNCCKFIKISKQKKMFVIDFIVHRITFRKNVKFHKTKQYRFHNEKK